LDASNYPYSCRICKKYEFHGSTHQDKVDKQKAPTVSSGGCSPSVAPYPSCHKAGTTRRSSSVWMLHIQRILPLNFDFMRIGLHCTGDVEKMAEYKTLANRPISTIQTSCKSSAKITEESPWQAVP